MTAPALPRPTPIPRRERLRAMMRDDVMTAARRIVQEEGFSALSMRALATEVGVTAPTLYEYYANKDAVLDALFLQGVETLQTEFDRIVSDSGNWLEKIAALGAAYRDFSKADPDLFLMVFGRVDASYEPGQPQRDASLRLMTPVIAAVQGGIESGEIRAFDPETVGRFLWSSVHGWVMLEANKVMRKHSADMLDELFSQHISFISETLRRTN